MNFAALKNKTIAVLLGGTSAEREVSLNSGRTVSDALRTLGYQVRDIDPADSVADQVKSLAKVTQSQSGCFIDRFGEPVDW